MPKKPTDKEEGASRGLQIKGKLEEVSVAEILVSLYEAKATCLFRTDQRNISRFFFIEKQSITLTSSNDFKDSLIAFLMARGDLTEEQLESIRKVGAAAERFSNTVLVEHKIISEEEFEASSRELIAYHLKNALVQDQGYYSVLLGAVPGKGARLTPVNLPVALYKALSDVNAERMINNWIGPLGNIPLPNPGEDFAGVDGMTLTSREKRVLERLDGYRDIEAVLTEIGGERAEMMAFIYWALLFDYISFDALDSEARPYRYILSEEIREARSMQASEDEIDRQVQLEFDEVRVKEDGRIVFIIGGKEYDADDPRLGGAGQVADDDEEEKSGDRIREVDYKGVTEHLNFSQLDRRWREWRDEIAARDKARKEEKIQKEREAERQKIQAEIELHRRQKEKKRRKKRAEADVAHAEAVILFPKLQIKTYYELLDVPNDAPMQKISSARRDRVARFDKDYYREFLQAGAVKAFQEIQAAIEKAYKVLSDPEERKKYDKNLALAEERRRRAQELREKRAGEYYAQALKYEEKGNRFEAVDKIRSAINMLPERIEYHQFLARLLMADRAYLKEAYKTLIHCITEDPNNASHYMLLREIFRDLGKKDKARKAYEKAVSLDPSLG